MHRVIDAHVKLRLNNSKLELETLGGLCYRFYNQEQSTGVNKIRNESLGNYFDHRENYKVMDWIEYYGKRDAEFKAYIELYLEMDLCVKQQPAQDCQVKFYDELGIIRGQCKFDHYVEPANEILIAQYKALLYRHVPIHVLLNYLSEELRCNGPDRTIIIVIGGISRFPRLVTSYMSEILTVNAINDITEIFARGEPFLTVVKEISVRYTDIYHRNFLEDVNEYIGFRGVKLEGHFLEGQGLRLKIINKEQVQDNFDWYIMALENLPHLSMSRGYYHNQ